MKTKEFSVDMNDMLKEILTKEGNVSKCFRLFHNYSIRNQFLAMYQMHKLGMPAQPINSFTGWKKLNRHVNKGEKALYLWQPFTMPVQVVDEETGEVKEDKRVIFRFKPSWFALEQTSGAELAKVNDLKLGDFSFDRVYKEFKIKVIAYNKVDGNCQGFARTALRELAINPLAEDVEMTTLHEIAHIVLEHNKVDFDTRLKELEAEAVAYIAGSIMGIPDEQLSKARGYIQGWFKSDVIPDKNASRIMSVANKIIKAGLGE